ncbi:MAG: hypothetical protein AAF402_11545, partial [Pseudomonadota bacterium]
SAFTCAGSKAIKNITTDICLIFSSESPFNNVFPMDLLLRAAVYQLLIQQSSLELGIVASSLVIA